MASGARSGNDMLIKLGSGSPVTYANIGGIRSRSFNLSTDTVDVTSSDNTDGWRELLEVSGIRSMSISGGGVFKAGNAAQEATLTHFMARTSPEMQIVVPDLGTFTGTFRITAITFNGEYNDAVGWDLSLESSGPITYEPVP